MGSILGKSAETVAGLSVGGYALLTIVAWKADLRQVLTLCEWCAPMQFNTAVLFLTLAIAILWASLVRSGERPRYVRLACGLVVASVGALTLAEWIMSTDFGIDQALHEHQLTTFTPAPGRMSPNTALAFVLAGGAIGVQRWAPFLAAAMSAAVLMIGLAALFGYQFNASQLYAWGEMFTHMAVNTAVLFVAAALGLLSASARCMHHSKKGAIQ